MMLYTPLSFMCVFVNIYVMQPVCSDVLTGDDEHICWENKSHTVVVPITKLAYYKKDKKYMCLTKFPLICTDTRVLTKTVVESKTIERLELIGTCCKGYTKIDGKCKPVCSERCFSQDDCVAPNYCVNCRGRFYGPFCDEECPLGYTKYCNVSCNCPPGGHYRCNSEVGCICTDGFQGIGCDIPVTQQRIQERITSAVATDSTPISLVYTLIPILLIALILMTLYYKRKIANLKDIINHLQIYTCNGSNYVRNFFPNPVYGNSSNEKKTCPEIVPTKVVIKEGFEKQAKLFPDNDKCQPACTKQYTVDDITAGGHLYHTIESDNNLYEGLKDHESINWKYRNNPRT